MTFDEEEWPRLRFAQNPLKVVVAQARFTTAYGLGDSAVHAAIQRAVVESHPKPLAAVQEVTLAVTPQGPTSPQFGQSAIRFGNEQETSIVTIGPSMVSYETTDYQGWEHFEPELARVLELASLHGAPSQTVRFGLRYVDELMVEGASRIGDWAEVLTERVIGTTDSLARDPRVTETTHRSSLRIDDDVVNVRHGYVRRQAADDSESSVYLIDSDIYNDVPRPWNPETIVADANRYRLWMRKIFGRSLTDAGIERLGGTAA